MKRKLSFILAAMLLFGTVPAYNAVSASPAVSSEAKTAVSAAAAFEFSDIVINLGANETEMNFVWYQNDATPGTLLLAKAEDIVDGVMPEDAAAFTCTSTLAADGNYSNQVTATGLEANTKYGYQPTCGENKADIWYFTTDGEDDFTFIYVADPQLGPSAAHKSAWASTHTFIENTEIFDDAAFMLSAGDEVNQNSVSAGETIVGNEAEYDVYLDHDFMREMPSMNVLGNHDVSERFGQHFHIANESTEAATMTSGNNNSYFLYNDVLFININGNARSASKIAAHRDYVKKVCEAHPNVKWRVVITHQSMYGVAYHATEAYILEMRKNFVPIYDEFDIDIVLQGHDHVYCRTFLMENFVALDDVSYYDDATYSSATDTEGTLYITANSGTGTKFYDFAYASGIMPFVAVQNQEHIPNVSKVYVSDNEFTVSTYRTSDGSLVDTFTLYKKAENAERLINLIDKDITLYSEEGITAARNAYDELTEEQQENVSNYDVLIAAEEALELIKNRLPDADVGLYIENLPESLAPGTEFTADIVAYSAELTEKEISAVNFTLEYSSELTLESIAPSEDIGGISERNGAAYAWSFDPELGGAVVKYQQPVKLATATFTLNSRPESGTAEIGFDTEALLNAALADDEDQSGFTPNVSGAEINVAVAAISTISAEKYKALAADQKIITIPANGANNEKYVLDYGNGNTEQLYYSSRYDKYVAIVDADMTESYLADILTRVSGESEAIRYNGDVNRDGRITAGDAAMISDLLHSYAEGSKASDKPYFSDIMRLEADLHGVYSENGDYVTVTDAMRTLFNSVGMK